MNKYIWFGCLSILMLTGCGESKEEERARKEKEFWTYTYDDSGDGAKRQKLYKECRDKNVIDVDEIYDEAKKISGTGNASNKEYRAVSKKMHRARDIEVAKCNKILSGK
ncbi:MAG: hypothetical protein ACHQAX_05820 [Gammaproteobacteria bacterium]